MARILIACEESQTVCEQFILLGHDAISCDVQPGRKGLPHHQGYLEDFIGSGREWDLIIGHPPCTRLANSGVLRLYKGGKKANGIDPVKWEEMLAGVAFFNMIWKRECPRICCENPIMHGHAKKHIGPHAQTIQPYQFGEDASKATCLWLKGLPPLQSTGQFPPRYVDGKPRWSNQTDSGQNKLAPTKDPADRQRERSVTYLGIAKAMAQQWSEALKQPMLF